MGGFADAPRTPLELRGFLPSEDSSKIVGQLFTPGTLMNAPWERCLAKLEGAGTVYRQLYPFGAWAPSLIVEPEMHRQTEIYFPLEEQYTIWRRFFKGSLKIQTDSCDVPFKAAASWLSIIEALRITVSSDPALLLRRALIDENFRYALIFAWHLPRRHGEGFGRYPAQMEWIRKWLCSRRLNGEERITCLDAACGTGEGTYELAEAVSSAGYNAHELCVVGETLSAIEVIAAALLWFPHDPARQTAVREIVGSVSSAVARYTFFRQRDLKNRGLYGEGYDLILCNGLLGGGLLHAAGDVEDVVENLSAQLKPGGVFLAADRFHAGWRRRFPLSSLVEMLCRAGLKPLPLPEGIGGVRQ